MVERILENQKPLRDALALHATNVTVATTARLDNMKKFGDGEDCRATFYMTPHIKLSLSLHSNTC
ncbi:hypothetical protein JOB18_006383 [Solea senegalensis]|uniref:Uncharacterized protein n=1 Tax=Solea senegalensis TaxID=28829 RepID=A0AAV6Q628_SOLSE|nr:hypothetical protein JOB18_006383 [Solea senegalensis]